MFFFFILRSSELWANRNDSLDEKLQIVNVKCLKANSFGFISNWFTWWIDRISFDFYIEKCLYETLERSVHYVLVHELSLVRISFDFLIWPSFCHFYWLFAIIWLIYGIVMDSIAKARSQLTQHTRLLFCFELRLLYFLFGLLQLLLFSKSFLICASWWQLYLFDSLDTNVKPNDKMTPFTGEFLF